MNKKILKPFAFRLDEELIREFRMLVKQTGYKTGFLMERAIKQVIKELKVEIENGKQ